MDTGTHSYLKPQVCNVYYKKFSSALATFNVSCALKWLFDFPMLNKNKETCSVQLVY